ncbi:MAG: alpha/beta fold hydrolase [Chloroflexia bacterium]|nr:alpha/beta fold hydrolase [Chloroflexia bacterium]
MLVFSNLKAQEIYSGNATEVEKDISSDFSFESKFLTLNADTIHHIESGEGDPILLLHGLPSNLYIWRKIIPNIDSNKKVIALDFLGFGKSSFPADKNVSVEVQYKMLKDFIEAKELKNVTFLFKTLVQLQECFIRFVSHKM